jgi:hypothetical protein
VAGEATLVQRVVAGLAVLEAGKSPSRQSRHTSRFNNSEVVHKGQAPCKCYGKVGHVSANRYHLWCRGPCDKSRGDRA